MPTAPTVTSPTKPVNSGEVNARHSKATSIILFLLIAAAVMVSVTPRDGCGFSAKETSAVGEDSEPSRRDSPFMDFIAILLIIALAAQLEPDCDS